MSSTTARRPCSSSRSWRASPKPAAGPSGARVYGLYNLVGSLAGALGALLAAVPGLLGESGGATLPFVTLVPVGVLGALLSWRLSPAIESAEPRSRGPRLPVSRRRVRTMAALFAIDAGGGGLVTASFLAYYPSYRYYASSSTLGALFFATSLLQAASVWAAPRLADRIGLVPTMVFTHLPSNVLLAAVAFAPTLPIAMVLLARTCLSQMDVPTRQALVMRAAAARGGRHQRRLRPGPVGVVQKSPRRNHCTHQWPEHRSVEADGDDKGRQCREEG